MMNLSAQQGHHRDRVAWQRPCHKIQFVFTHWSELVGPTAPPRMNVLTGSADTPVVYRSKSDRSERFGVPRVEHKGAVLIENMRGKVPSTFC